MSTSPISIITILHIRHHEAFLHHCRRACVGRDTVTTELPAKFALYLVTGWARANGLRILYRDGELTLNPPLSPHPTNARCPPCTSTSTTQGPLLTACVSVTLLRRWMQKLTLPSSSRWWPRAYRGRRPTTAPESAAEPRPLLPVPLSVLRCVEDRYGTVDKRVGRPEPPLEPDSRGLSAG